jgi:hypothetical protein
VAALLKILDDDDPPALAISFAGGKAGCVEDAMEHRVVDRSREELAHGARPAPGFDEVHGSTVVV